MPDYTELNCPTCGENYLHHTSVEVFNRKEDAQEGLHVTVSTSTTDAVTQDGNLEGNPSFRRDGIAIHLWCEACHGTPTLYIAQHKGETLVTYE